NTEYALCYCKDRANPAMVRRVRAILQSARPELLLDSSYFLPWLFPTKLRLFAPVSYTERPAVAVAKLCEGKLVILVNGSPSALVLPSLFCENFDCLDDYATTAVFSSLVRLLKYGAFYLSIFLPGLFVCLAVYLPELIPPQLLFKIEAAEKATPLPLFAEMLLIIVILEIIREAGLRMPQTLGHAVSLVAALIVGDAAIAAGLMSTPVLLVAGVTSVSIFVTPALYEPATLLRLAVTLAAGLAGPVGLVGAALAVLFGLTDVSALGVAYLSGAVFSEDGVIRRNYRALSRRPFTIWKNGRRKDS
ncbi:MAG: spore germination protein, partial [Ruminococcaceae bacterium]|nr:spore germination protein [Oscillospiraceae bacterium]